MNSDHLLFLTIFWLGYFVIHSILASNGAKQACYTRFNQIEPAYRLLYNIVSTLLLIPMVYYIYFVPSKTLIQWHGALAIFADLLALAAFAGFIYSFKFYQGSDFLGLTQFKTKSNTASESFVISPLHRWVRHPWYLFALVIIWTRDMNAHFLLSACFITAYFYIGSYFEERKMVQRFGDNYEQYIACVPRIIPSLRKRLSPSHAANLSQKD